MAKTVLQIPIDVALRNEAEASAIAAGFSSLQEVVRVFLKSFAQKKVVVDFMSEKAEKRYTTMVNDVGTGKYSSASKSVDELINVLR